MEPVMKISTLLSSRQLANQVQNGGVCHSPYSTSVMGHLQQALFSRAA